LIKTLVKKPQSPTQAVLKMGDPIKMVNQEYRCNGKSRIVKKMGFESDLHYLVVETSTTDLHKLVGM
jgi:hypothetical protein